MSRVGLERGDRRAVALAQALGALSLGAGLATAALLAALVDQAIVGGRHEALAWLVPVFLLALALDEGAGYLAGVTRARLALRAAGRLRGRLLARYLSLPAERQALLDRGRVLQDLGEHGAAVEHFVASVLLPLPLQALTVLSVAAVLVWLCPLLASVTLVTAPAAYLVAHALVPATRGRRREAAARASATFSWLQSILGRARDLRLLGRADWAAERYQQRERERAGAMLRWQRLSEATQRGARLAAGLATVAVLSLGALLLTREGLSLGALLAFNALLLRLFGPVQALGRARTEWASTEVVLASMEALRDEPVEDGGGQAPFGFREALCLEDVHFRYPGEGGRAALAGIGLVLRPGERLGIVGDSGAGKSTLLAILVRLFAPGQGSLRLDGRPAGDFELAEWRRQVRLLAQNSPLFPGTLAENVSLGLPHGEVPAGAVEDAIAMAGLARTVARLPMGLDTPLGPEGEQLSGGELRRVALARALASRPRVLVLDEPFAGLDPGLRTELEATLAELRARQELSLVVVSHELAALEGLVERIVVLREGRVEYDGPAAKLLREHARHERLAFPAATPGALDIANASLAGAGLPACLFPAPSGGWAAELPREGDLPLRVVAFLRATFPELGDVVLGPAGFDWLSRRGAKERDWTS